MTHPYFPVAPGDRLAWSGFGIWSGDLRLLTGLTVELDDGVQCLRVPDEDYSSRSWTDTDGTRVFESVCLFWQFWLAQDVDGNVWLLKKVDFNDVETVYGAAGPSPELWSDLVVGDTWASGGGAVGEVLSLTSSVGRPRTGGGPYQG